MTIQPHSAFDICTPDEVAETWEGIFSFGNLYETLWSCTEEYQKFDREDCGPHDVIGINSVASFWERFTDEQKEQLNKCAVARDEWLNSMIPSFD